MLTESALMERLTSVADVKMQVDICSPMNNYMKDFISLKTDHIIFQHTSNKYFTRAYLAVHGGLCHQHQESGNVKSRI